MASRIASLTDFAALSPPWLLTSLDQNSTNIEAAFNDSSLGYINAISTDSGSANNYAVTCIYGTPTAYNAGMHIAFIPANTNTGASVITVSPLGSLTIVDSSGNALQAGEILAGRICELICMGTVFRLINTLSTGGVPYYYDWDDFVGPPKFLSVGNNGGSGAISGPWQAQIVGYPGIWEMAPGTTASSWSRMYMSAGVFLDSFTYTVRSQVYIPTGSFSSSNQFFVGMTDNPGPVLNVANHYVGIFAASATSSDWQAYTRNAATVTQTDTGIAVSTNSMVDMMIVATATQVLFYINGSLVVTTTTTIPASTQLMYPCVFTNNGGNNNNLIFLAHTFEILITGAAQVGTLQRFLKGPI